MSEIIIQLFFCNLLLSLLLMKIRWIKIFDPVFLFLFFNYLTITLSFIYNYFIEFENKINLFNFDEISDSFFNLQLSYSLLALMSFQIGVLLFYLFYLLIMKKTKFVKKTKCIKYIQKKKMKVNYLVLFGSFLLFFILFTNLYGGVTEVLKRDYYLPQNRKLLEIILIPLTIYLIIQVGKLFEKNKLLSLSLVSFIMLLEFSTSSRKSIIYLLIYLLIIYPYIQTKIGKVYYFIIGFISILFILLSALGMRNLQLQGILPNIGAITSHADMYIDGLYFLIYYSFIYGSYVSAQTIQMNTFTLDIFLTSINPLPGFMTDWYSIIDQIRILPIVPQNMYGEIYTLGYFMTIIFFIILGIITSYININIFTIKNKIINLIIIIFYILFLVYAFEYPMRSALRFIYYIIVILLIYNFIYKFYKKRIKV